MKAEAEVSQKGRGFHRTLDLDKKVCVLSCWKYKSFDNNDFV